MRALLPVMEATADPSSLPLAQPRSQIRVDGLTVAGTILVILAAAVLLLMTPWAMHQALDAAGSAAWLQTDAATTHALSDQTVSELLFGPGTFDFPGPDGAGMYDATEVGHMQDVRNLVWALLGAAALAALGIVVALVRRDEPGRIVRAVGTGGAVTAIGVGVIGVVGLVAFEPLFETFHVVFFPGGNWAFDPRTQHLVQLYPYAFWELMAAALGVLAAVIGALVWLVARGLIRPAPVQGAR